MGRRLDINGGAEQLLGDPGRIAAVGRARLRLGEPGGWPDALAALLAHATGAPIALVNLVDDEYEASVGAYGPVERSPRPVADSLCEAVVRGGVPAIAQDATLDRRFAGKRPVREGGVRAYAGFPIRDAAGELVGVVSVVDDRARHEWAARDLAAIDGAARIVSAALSDPPATPGPRPDLPDDDAAPTRDEYIALVGHEMRTPLTSIAAFTELISDNPDDTPLREVRDLLGVVERNTALLRGVIDDLLDLAALDAGHAPLRTRPIDVADLVRESAGGLRPVATGQGVELTVDAPESCVLEGDPARLRQVLDSLLENAIRYSLDGGPVTVAVKPAPGHVDLIVADRGIGIPEDERAHVFRRFFRSSLAHDRRIPGTGLGLAIASVIVQRHGGTITLAAQDGPGTTMLLRLPLPLPGAGVSP